MRKPRKVDLFVAREQGKHHCQCGCGKLIVITKNHYSNGIPKYISGHNGRVHYPKNGYLDREQRKQWVTEHQGKHRCQCGCDEVIMVTQHHYGNGIPRYIHGHQQRVREYPADVERFWEAVDRNGEDKCWSMKRKDGSPGRHTAGYVGIRSDNPAVKGLAHRLSYLIHYGSLDTNLDVLHSCDHPWCVNPNHLFQGTHRDNMKDAALKGKFAKKRTVATVLRAVELLRSGMRQCEVARLTGIGASGLCGIMNGEIWAHHTGISKKG